MNRKYRLLCQDFVSNFKVTAYLVIARLDKTKVNLWIKANKQITVILSCTFPSRVWSYQYVGEVTNLKQNARVYLRCE